MDQLNAIPRETTIDLNSIVDTLDDIVRSFSQFLQNAGSSALDQESMSTAPEGTRPEGDGGTHEVLDLVQDYANHTSDIQRDLKALRKALPATYFKNRSRIRDTFEGIETTSAKCQANAYAIMEALQSQELMSEQYEHIANAVKDVSSKLNSVRTALSR